MLLLCEQFLFSEIVRQWAFTEKLKGDSSNLYSQRIDSIVDA